MGPQTAKAAQSVQPEMTGRPASRQKMGVGKVWRRQLIVQLSSKFSFLKSPGLPLPRVSICYILFMQDVEITMYILNVMDALCF